MQGVGNICILSPTTQTPFITNRLVTIVHTKAVNSNFSTKIGCHGNVPQHLWTPIQHMIPTAHPSPQAKRHPYRFSRLWTGDRRVSLYFTIGRPFSPKICPFPWGDLDPHLIRGSQAHPSTQTQTAARSVQPFLQGSLVWQTDHATRSVRIGRIYVRSTAMRPKNNRASLVRPTLILWPSDSFQNSNIIMLNAHLATVGKLAVIKQLDLLTVTLVELQRSLDNHSVSQSTEAQMSQLIWQTVIAC